MADVSVIIAAAGKATRMNGINKLTAQLAGKPVIAYSLELFEKMDEVKEIIIAAGINDFSGFTEAARKYGITKFAGCAEGGSTRQQSVISALRHVSRDTKLVAIHDGARPFPDPQYVRRCIKDASVFGGAALGVPVKDTIKQTDGGLITDTPDRSRLFIIQTPQIFKKKHYFEGVDFALEHDLDFTDDCQLCEAVGVKVCVTPSDYRNIKITTPEDLLIAEALLKQAIAF